MLREVVTYVSVDNSSTTLCESGEDIQKALTAYFIRK